MFCFKKSDPETLPENEPAHALLKTNNPAYQIPSNDGARGAYNKFGLDQAEIVTKYEN